MGVPSFFFCLAEIVLGLFPGGVGREGAGGLSLERRPFGFTGVFFRLIFFCLCVCVCVYIQ